MAVSPLFALLGAFIAFGASLLAGAASCVLAVMRARREEEPFMMDAAMAVAMCAGAFQLGRALLTRGVPAVAGATAPPARPVPWGGAGFFGLLVSALVLTGAIVAIRRARRF